MSLLTVYKSILNLIFIKTIYLRLKLREWYSTNNY